MLGISTGALPASFEAAYTLNLSLGATAVELSALSEPELPELTHFLATITLPKDLRVSVHGPAKNREMPEQELVTLLASLNFDVVMHPDIFQNISLWRQLGSRLLIENNDSRKPFGQSATDLATFFNLLPEARFCLDVSHALDTGTPSHPIFLAQVFQTRLAQLHLGCACGQPATPEISSELINLTNEVLDTVGSKPIIIERRFTSAEATTHFSRLRALLHA